jgi:hypothetical protein
MLLFSSKSKDIDAQDYIYYENFTYKQVRKHLQENLLEIIGEIKKSKMSLKDQENYIKQINAMSINLNDKNHQKEDELSKKDRLFESKLKNLLKEPSTLMRIIRERIKLADLMEQDKKRKKEEMINRAMQASAAYLIPKK